MLVKNLLVMVVNYLPVMLVNYLLVVLVKNLLFMIGCKTCKYQKHTLRNFKGKIFFIGSDP